MVRSRQNRVGVFFKGLIPIICVVLSFLHYAWTGELARAEPALLRGGLPHQVRRPIETILLVRNTCVFR
jgi:hypothetical protein